MEASIRSFLKYLGVDAGYFILLYSAHHGYAKDPESNRSKKRQRHRQLMAAASTRKAPATPKAAAAVPAAAAAAPQVAVASPSASGSASSSKDKDEVGVHRQISWLTHRIALGLLSAIVSWCCSRLRFRLYS